MTTDTKYDVLCIGNAIVDILARVDDDFLAQHDRIKSAMNLVDETLSKALYDAIPPAQEQSGGSAGNTAAGAALLGSKVAYIGKVHDDQLGRVFAHDIRAVGVDFDTATLKEGPSTATSIILITPDAERTMNTYLGACVELTVDDIDEAIVAASKVTYVEGYLWDSDKMKAAVSRAMELAHKHNREVALSLSDSFCVDRFRSEFRDLVTNDVDILFANEDELLSLYQLDDLEEALTKLASEVKAAAVTLGEKGSVVIHDGKMVRVPAQATQVDDTTGAGDLFAAGYLHGYTHDRTPEVWGQLGSIAAAEVISHVGARPLADLTGLVSDQLGPDVL